MNYKVLARKYRPQTFKDLIGQDTLVKTFKNALNQGRLAHSFLLTGIRGVGKTTTARIIAKAFNCEGNENKNPTFEICNNCKPCISITNGNCLDVLEVDAASKTGVDNIREIIDTVMYSPNEARYKIYIIDEVHMLSIQAFNALLKTLEEPPNSSKFIFATTEIRKIPATIISRCQRFDLKRIDLSNQVAHLKNIAKLEDISIDEQSLHQISISSEGSLRDALSILDQAAALMKNEIVFVKLKNMLGLNNYENYYELLDLSLKSKAKEACNLYDEFINNSIPSSQIINTLTLICTKVARFLIDESVYEEDNTYKKHIFNISQHGMTQVIRTWQILIKGLEEIKNSNNEIESGLMTIIKICYASKIPLPNELIKSLNTKILQHKNEDISKNLNQESKKSDYKSKNQVENSVKFEQEQKTSINRDVPDENYEQGKPNSVDEMLQLLIKSKEALLHAQLINNIIIHDFKYGEIELELSKNAENSIILKLKNFLQKTTGINWQIKETFTKNNEKTIAEKNKILENEKNSKVLEEPNVKEIFDHFPESKIEKIENNSEIKSS